STISSNRIIGTRNNEDNNVVSIIKNNDDPVDYVRNTVPYEYFVIRVANKSLKSSIFKNAVRHPNMKILLEISYTLGSTDLWTKIREQLVTEPDPKINASGIKFNLVG